jgi:lipoate-protein ligase A
VEEEVLEEERVDNVEEEQTELPAEEDDVSEIIQKLTAILDSAKEQGFTVNELEIEKKRKSNKHYSMK